jgi:hypothetical protein
MYSLSRSIDPYDPKTADALKEAIEATWVMLQARDPFRDLEPDSELRAALSRRLKVLASDGVPIQLSFANGLLRAFRADRAARTSAPRHEP